MENIFTDELRIKYQKQLSDVLYAYFYPDVPDEDTRVRFAAIAFDLMLLTMRGRIKEMFPIDTNDVAAQEHVMQNLRYTQGKI